MNILYIICLDFVPFLLYVNRKPNPPSIIPKSNIIIAKDMGSMKGANISCGCPALNPFPPTFCGSIPAPPIYPAYINRPMANVVQRFISNICVQASSLVRRLS